MIDTTSEFGSRVTRRLQEEYIVWLITNDTTQTPQPSPVWFHWDGTNFLIYSKPDAPKMRNIATNARVALHLNSDEEGGDVVIFIGVAQHVNEVPAERVAAYLSKYDRGIKGLEMTSEEFANSYSAPILVTPSKIRGF